MHCALPQLLVQVVAKADKNSLPGLGPQKGDGRHARLTVGVEVYEDEVGVRRNGTDPRWGEPRAQTGHDGLQLAFEEEIVADEGDHPGGAHARHDTQPVTERTPGPGHSRLCREAVMGISTVGVVGAGLMGSGIAEVSARQGLVTRVVESDADALAAGRQRVERSLERGRSTGKLETADVERILGDLHFSTDLTTLADCDVVIECIPERLADKLDLFAKLDDIVADGAILATNTSSLPVIEIARATRRPDRVIGTHFFNPAPVMKLLEVVKSIATSDETVAEIKEFGERLGKRIIVAQDRGGFIVNLLLIPYLNSAARLFESGFASRDDIDEGMRLGCGHPMGPLELLDYIGIDTAVLVCDALYEEYAVRDYAAPPLLKRMLAAGFLGRKSGRGFYRYENGKRAD